ncbi:serine/threonine-protein phosphatase 2A activator isoform X1 [Nilaparvata lugens]|uniref:serine/threonine-protein phosphatase 2A activator isoform X1 n=2 Tax=Nilaparvata lugens TaxID=108931 RepID=UPI000B98863B|nr:serine/threonine-protein phosphatase 2A activator isoform X1 [Nilaparvata lugens]
MVFHFIQKILAWLYLSVIMSCVNVDEFEFVPPKKAVLKMSDMEVWEKSEAYLEYMGFIMAMNEAVKHQPMKLSETPERLKGMMDLLKTLDDWVDEIPPIEQPQRFGNKAFRTWCSKLNTEALQLLHKALPENLHRAVPEIKEYLVESFGSASRIDYGTGHEMAFCMFLCCLFKIGAFERSQSMEVIFLVFNSYLELVRKLQTVYRMEPAGSRGVWSLDDYQFIPFIWGSSQLIDHPRIEPRSFVQPDIVESFYKDYMFLGCIKFINQVKKGPFAEHSNQLWNISAVGYWSKVNQGLIKMYKAEVLSKFPVIQHVLFGSLLPFRIPPKELSTSQY